MVSRCPPKAGFEGQEVAKAETSTVGGDQIQNRLPVSRKFNLSEQKGAFVTEHTVFWIAHRLRGVVRNLR